MVSMVSPVSNTLFTPGGCLISSATNGFETMETSPSFENNTTPVQAIQPLQRDLHGDGVSAHFVAHRLLQASFALAQDEISPDGHHYADDEGENND
jgi:hypothetical protein